MIQCETMRSTFGRLIKARREQRGMLANEVAARMRRPASFVSRLETEAFRETPAPDVLADLESILGIPQAEMLAALGYRVTPPAAVPVTEPERADLLQKLERVGLDDESRVAALTAILDLWLRQDRDAERPIQDFVVDPRNRRAGPFDHDLAPHNP